MHRSLVILMLILTLLLGLFVPSEQALAEEEKPSELTHGFKLLREEELPDISSTAYLYEHEKSGAHLLWLKNEDPFKVFAACFKTKMSNNSGAPHIVEHAVLGGSRKYKSDDIFTDMNSRSTNAFMNAMTYPDKTIFPIASRDPQDFYNLTDVYLDSVFFPMILENRKFFDREGWRYEIFSPEDDLTYNGVVYNEMTGALSDPMRNFLFETLASIYPDTFYRYNSGGVPQYIPDLSYEEFKDFYQSYYSPGNALLYFYGDLDIDTYLEHIDEDYLSHFDKPESTVEYEKQEPFAERREQVVYYNLDDEASEDGQTYMSLNYLTGDGGDVNDTFTNIVLSYTLFDSSSAPVKEALLDAGIGAQSGSFSLAFNQNTLGVAVLNANTDQKNDFVQIVEETIQKTVEEGLDKDNIMAIINFLDLSYREANGTNGLKGMDYLQLILDSYNYGGDPLAYLKFTEIFDALRAKVDTGEYEQYIQEKILDNPTSSLLILEPQKGLAAQVAQETADKLAEYKASLSEEELAQLVADSEDLRDKPVFDEADYNLPSLKLSEIEPDINFLPFEAEQLDKYTLVTSPQVTGGINYLDLQFDLSVVPEEDLPYVGLLSYLLGTLDTENYSKGDLEKAVLSYTGGISFTPSDAAHKDTAALDSRFEVAASATTENIDQMLDLIEEISLRTKFEDTKWIGEQIKALRNGMETSASSNAIGLGIQRVRSYFDPVFAYREQYSGLDYLRFIQEVDSNFAENPQPYLDKLEAVSKQIFNTPNLVVGLAGAESDFTNVKASLTALIDRLPAAELENGQFDVTAQKLNEGISVNSGSNYVIKAAKLSDYTELNGSRNVVTLVLDNLYLYPELRAKGGAYGAYSFIDNYGNFAAYSYSDPNLRETVEAFDNMGDFLNDLDLSEEDLEQVIIGYFKAYPVPGADAASQVAYRYINGFSNDYYAKEAQEVLGTKLEDIKAYGEAIKAAMQEGNNLIVLGNQAKIKENADLFDQLVSIVESKVAIPEEAVAADPEDPILGTWVFDSFSFDENYFPSSALGIEVTYEFLEDGTFLSYQDGESYPPALWLNEDGVYYLFEDGSSLEANLAEEKLSFEVEGIKMYFHRVELEEVSSED
ncbi:MAG: insulinase family protein [Eubacteriales bacterium]|nr:insulinase family protein [Eubacteriales bacterium]